MLNDAVWVVVFWSVAERGLVALREVFEGLFWVVC